MAPSSGRRRGAQRPRPRILQLQDCSQVEWLQPDSNPGQDSSQAPITQRPTQSHLPRGRSGSPRLVFTHRSWGRAAMAGLGGWGSRSLPHSVSQLPWLYCAGPTPTFDLWYIQTRKRRLWGTGAGDLGGVKTSCGGVGCLWDGAHFWGFWDWLRSCQVDTVVFACILRDRRWHHETTSVLPDLSWICDLRRWTRSQAGKSERTIHENYSDLMLFVISCSRCYRW